MFDGVPDVCGVQFLVSFLVVVGNFGRVMETPLINCTLITHIGANGDVIIYCMKVKN